MWADACATVVQDGVVQEGQERLRKPLSALPKQPSSVESWLQVCDGVVCISMVPRSQGSEGSRLSCPTTSCHSKTPR
jgi:hypothetical protein